MGILRAVNFRFSLIMNGVSVTASCPPIYFFCHRFISSYLLLLSSFHVLLSTSSVTASCPPLYFFCHRFTSSSLLLLTYLLIYFCNLESFPKEPRIVCKQYTEGLKQFRLAFFVKFILINTEEVMALRRLKRNNKYCFWKQSTAGTDGNPNYTLRINSFIMYVQRR